MLNFLFLRVMGLFLIIIFGFNCFSQDNTSLGTGALAQSQVSKYPISHIRIDNPGSYSKPTLNLNNPANSQVLYQYVIASNEWCGFEAELRSTSNISSFSPTLVDSQGNLIPSTMYVSTWEDNGYYYSTVYGNFSKSYVPAVTFEPVIPNYYYLYVEITDNNQLQIEYDDDISRNIFTQAPIVNISFGGATATAILSETTTNNGNTAVGYESQLNTISSKNTSLGAYALKSNRTGQGNTSIGYESLKSNTLGGGNTAVGVYALFSNSMGFSNNAIGFQSLYKNTSGYYNNSLGSSVLFNNTSGSYNIGIGNSALYNNTGGGQNIAIGGNSLFLNTLGGSNVAIGRYSGYNLSTGNTNIFLGLNAGMGISTGSNNTILGANVINLPAGLSNTVIIANGEGNQRFYSPASGNVILGRGNNPSDDGFKLDVGGTGRFGGALTITADPILSTSNYDILTRNRTNGRVEKVDLSNYNFLNQAQVDANPYLATNNLIVKRTAEGDIAAREVILTQPIIHQDVVPASLTGIYPTTNQLTKYSSKAVKSFLGIPESGETLASVIARGGSSTSSLSVALNQHETLRVGHNTNLNTSWYGTGTFGKDGSDKALLGYLGSITNGAIIGAHNSDLNAWSRLNLAGSELIFRIAEQEKVRIQADGNVGIGTISATEKLSVNGNIKAKAVKVDPNAWPDYVFEKDYPLASLSSVEKFIQEKGHLSDIPSAAEVAKEGIELGTLGASLLKKIEELTLYLIQKDKELLEANKRIDKLTEEIKKIKP